MIDEIRGLGVIVEALLAQEVSTDWGSSGLPSFLR